MESIKELKKEHLENIKLIVFDVDGVLVPRGTKIKQMGNTTILETKLIEKKTGLVVKAYAVNDAKRHDPQNKAKKSKPGKPGIYLE